MLSLQRTFRSILSALQPKEVETPTYLNSASTLSDLLHFNFRYLTLRWRKLSYCYCAKWWCLTLTLRSNQLSVLHMLRMYRINVMLHRRRAICLCPTCVLSLRHSFLHSSPCWLVISARLEYLFITGWLYVRCRTLSVSRYNASDCQLKFQGWLRRTVHVLWLDRHPVDHRVWYPRRLSSNGIDLFSWRPLHVLIFKGF
jgi:hypothetical protein